MGNKFEKVKGEGAVKPADRSALARDIDENLKRVYTAQLQEEVPDRFKQLLAQLRQKEGKA
jgi:hypothetical protein